MIITETFNDVAQGISSVMTTFAIIIAGLWAFWKFFLEKEREPRAEFDLSAEFLGVQDGKWIIEVSAHLANRGKVRHLMKNPTMNLRYLRASDKVAESADKDHLGQLYFPHSIVRRQVWKESYIDPGLEFRNSYLTWVPDDAVYVLILCKFEYERGEWPAQRVLKVPALPTQRADVVQHKRHHPHEK
jgi:hypothetical protein